MILGQMRAVTAHNDVNEASFDYNTALYIESVLAQGSPESAGCKEYLHRQLMLSYGRVIV